MTSPAISRSRTSSPQTHAYEANLSASPQSTSENVQHDLKEIYDFYDRSLFLTQRRFGLPVTVADPSNALDAGLQASESPPVSDSRRNAVEEELLPLHASRIYMNVRTVQAAVREWETSAVFPCVKSHESRPPAAEPSSHMAAVSPSLSVAHDGVLHSQLGGRHVSSITPDASPSMTPAKSAIRSPARNRMHVFARKRLGKLLADIVISCSCLAQATGLSSVEEQARSLHQAFPTSTDPLTAAMCEESRGPSPAVLRSQRTSVVDKGTDTTLRKFTRTPRMQSDRSCGVPGAISETEIPFLAFELVNSAEDLATLDFDDDRGDPMWLSVDSVAHGVMPRVVRTESGIRRPGSAPPPLPIALSRSPSGRAPTTALNSHSDNGVSLGGKMQVISGTGSPRGTLRPPSWQAGKPGSHPMQSMLMLPHSPSASFKPALSFTSLESPLQGAPGQMRQAFSNAPVQYVVDEPSIAAFLSTLRSVRALAAEPSTSEKEFEELGLKFGIPGIFAVQNPSCSPAPPIMRTLSSQLSSSSGAAAAGAADEFAVATEACIPAIYRGPQVVAAALSPPPFAVPRSISNPDFPIDAGGHVSRVNSFSTRRSVTSPHESGLALIDNGLQTGVKLKEFGIFDALVRKVLMDVDLATGGVHRLVERSENELADVSVSPALSRR